MTRFVTSLIAAAMLTSGIAAAQDYPRNTASSPGVPGSGAVNPAPDGRDRAYLGGGMPEFYDPMHREEALRKRLDSALSSGALNARKAHAIRRELSSVVAEDAIQKARHGDLRDWDRERLNDMMNHIVAEHPELRS